MAYQSMPKVPWHLFHQRKPRAHLVVGAIFEADGPAGLGDSTAALAVLRRLARKQKPAGDSGVGSTPNYEPCANSIPRPEKRPCGDFSATGCFGKH